MHLLTVGEMARLNHVSEQTLRLYDREGLLCPCVRKENGYRYYDIKQSVELDVIQYMKSLGISLKEIRQQLKTRDIEGVERALRDRDRQLMEEMRALQCRRSAVRRTLESLAFYRSAPPDGVLQLEYMPARQAYVPVSYTHLDVYKRQVYILRLQFWAEAVSGDAADEGDACAEGRQAAQGGLYQR